MSDQEEARSRLDEAILNLQWIVDHPLVFTPRLRRDDRSHIACACGALIDARRSMNEYLS